MKDIAIQALALIVALIVALAIGFGAGWHAKSVSVAAGQAKAAHAETAAIVADVTKQATDQHAGQVAEQGKSLDLAGVQQSVRDLHVQIQEQISHAVFVPYAMPAGAATCPDPAATAEFVRLYNSAAAGSADPAASTSTR
jgi:hypothetical protein